MFIVSDVSKDIINMKLSLRFTLNLFLSQVILCTLTGRVEILKWYDLVHIWSLCFDIY